MVQPFLYYVEVKVQGWKSTTFTEGAGQIFKRDVTCWCKYHELSISGSPKGGMAG